MTPTRRARRAEALYHGEESRRELCDRIVLLENSAECLLHCVSRSCEGCPALDDSRRCMAESDLRTLGIARR